MDRAARCMGTGLAMGFRRALSPVRRLAAITLLIVSSVAAAREFQPPIAVTNVKIIPEPGRVIEKGTILIEDGRIVAVGEDVEVPAWAETVDGSKLVAYAGFIDACTHLGMDSDQHDEQALARLQDESPNTQEHPFPSMFAANRNGLTPQWRSVDLFAPKKGAVDKHRQAGFAAALVAPKSAIVGGRSMLLNLTDDPFRRAVLRDDVAMHAGLRNPARGGFGGRDGQEPNRSGYPGTLMGVMAHFRQAMQDARWYTAMHAYARQHPGDGPLPPTDAVLAALQQAVDDQTAFVFHVNNERDIGRAMKLAGEFHLPLMIAGARQAWRIVDTLQQTDVPVIVSLEFPDEPPSPDKEKKKGEKKKGEKKGKRGKKKGEPADEEEEELEAPPADEESAEQRDAEEDEEDEDAEADEDEDVADSQPTDTQPGEEEPKTKTISDEDWENQEFEPMALVKARHDQWLEEEVDNLRRLHAGGLKPSIGTYEMESPGGVLGQLRKVIKRGLSADDALADLTTHPAALLGVSDRLGRIRPGYRANLTLLTAPLEDEKAKVAVVFVDGQKHEYDKNGGDKGKTGPDRGGRGGRRGGRGPDSDINLTDEPKQETEEAASESTETESTDTEVATRKSGKSDDAADEETTTTAVAATEPAEVVIPDDIQEVKPNVSWAIETEQERLDLPDTGGDVLLKNATVLTVTEGVLEDTDILVRDGKIAAIGENLDAPDGVMTIDLTGYTVMPGIIDPHSHICSDGGLNEWTMSVTPEVNVYDVLDNRDLAMCRALAGGVTSILTLHGSANTIGGQSAILKLKYKRPIDTMLYPDAPQPIKFALGENVKRSNSSRRQTRYPGTRLGVEVTLRRAFTAAQNYRKAWTDYAAALAAGEDAPPPRKDLRLEALSRILSGDIWVNCHSYRADEILRLFAVAEDYGFRIGVLQHVLEGYRIVPEIARHGCGASTFSDWWAYKVEAYNAIPHNAAMMTQGGVCATVNSDSAEVIRHLNLEAAKSLRYGGLDADEALRLCTINGAKQLGIDKHVGSIEVGKDADLAVFNGHPLDTFSHCVLTIIDGEVFFKHRDFDIESPSDDTRPAFEAPKPIEPLEIPKPKKKGLYAIKDATVHTIGGRTIKNATVIVRDGKIARVGQSIDIPRRAAVIDADGLHVYPGLIDVGTDHGLAEIGSVRATNDSREIGTFMPEVRACSGINPFSAHIGVSRCDGVLTALVTPRGGTIAGQSSLVDLAGWSMPEMLDADEVALGVNLPSLPTRLPEKDARKRKNDHKAAMDRIHDYFDRAARYAKMRESADEGADVDLPDDDMALAAMVPYVRGEKPVGFSANSQKQILEALRFADRHNLKPIIFGGREAWMCADILAKFNVPVVFTGTMGYPRGQFEPWDANYTTAAKLADAGVRFCFATGGSDLSKNIRTDAGMAVAHGLDEDAAVRAMTLSTAEILGVDESLGSIEKGKTANLIVTTGHPCQAATRVVFEMIRGEPIPLVSKHTENYEKFKNRPAPDLPPPAELVGPKRISGPVEATE